MKTILCIGAGHVGGPTMAVIACRCPEYRVLVVDVDAARIRAWQYGPLPIYEPGLDALVRAARGRNLFFSTDIARGIEEADMIFVSVNTPTKTFGEGAGRAADLQYVESTARQILAHAKSDRIVVEKSTLPVRTAEAIEQILRSGAPGVHFEVLSNPEFLAEGSAIRDLEEPDRVLIGGRDTESGRRAAAELADIYAHWVPRERILTVGIWSSELSKLAANAFLAQRISSVNSLSALCERTEADIVQVASAVGMDARIGPRFLNVGVGFGGSCFRKDILNLAYLCERYGLDEEARYWEQVVRMNDRQRTRFVHGMIGAMFNTVAGKRIALFGFAFKPDTADTRDSPAIGIARALLDERAEAVITDPRALDNARRELANDARVRFESDPYRAAEGAHAVALLTDWEEFKRLDYRRIHAVMARPAFFFDGRNCLDHAALFQIGFNVFPIGRPPLSHLSAPQ
ncbi:MAG: nucleotide sugar dehydrogenase [Verrucomicrobiota bacterium]|nr:nucleotide sugar dehydrogenase [Verrucomicrobiota bacterium]